MGNIFLALGGISGALAVVVGAFGAHGLKAKLSPEMLSIYQTGVQYHFYHTFALLAIGGLCLYKPPSNIINACGYFFIAGIILFSGSLYALAISGVRALGAITPIGGVLLIVAWILFTVAAIKN